jgi:hypothetical protein
MKRNEVRLGFAEQFLATEVVLLKKLGKNEVLKTVKQWGFEESDPELDHAGDIDYVAKIGDKTIGIQIKPVTAKSNFGNYSATERMQASFADFEAQFGGKVFVVFSLHFGATPTCLVRSKSLYPQ